MVANKLRAALWPYLLLVVSLAVSVVLGGCATQEGQLQSGQLQVGGPSSAPPQQAIVGLPPIPMDAAPAGRSASVIQTITLNGNETSQRSAGAVDDGTNLSLVSSASGLQWAIYEFTPPAGALQSMIFTMDVANPGSAWIAIANYDKRAWEFKGPYPSLAGAKAFLGLASGDYVSPGGRVYAAAVSYNSTTASVETVQISVDDGAQPTFTVSGTVTNSVGAAPLAGVTVSLQGSSEAPTLTDALGQYSFSGIEAGNYTLIPSLTSFTFNPPSQGVNVINADISGQDFVGTLQVGGPPYTISGTIMNGDTPLAGVTVMVPFEQLDTVTDAQGNYSFEINDEILDFRVVPLLSGFGFTPNIAFLTGNSDQTQDFSASAYTIPGTVSYATHMKPLVFEPVCMNCHNSAYGPGQRHGAPVGVNWDSHGGTDNDTKILGNTRANNGSMPPFGFHATINLTDSQKALFQKWLDGGFQQ